MIQRIQTVYLIGVIFLGFLMYFFSYGEIISSSETYVFKSTGIFQIVNGAEVGIRTTIPVILFILVIIVIAGISIFKYKSRLFQIKLCKLNMLILTGLLVVLFFYLESYENEPEINYKIGIFIPMISIALTFLAIRAIKKDEELLRAANRIR